MKGLKKSTENLSHKFGSKRNLATSLQSIADREVDTPAPPPSETPAEIKYEVNANVVGPKSSRFMNAMDMQNIRGGSAATENGAAESNSGFDSYPAATASAPASSNVLNTDPETFLRNSVKGVSKGEKCELKVADFELHCIDPSKNKPFKYYFPMELRRIVSIDVKGTQVTLNACVVRESNNAGSKLKDVSFDLESPVLAKLWSEALEQLVFGGTKSSSMARSVLILADKSDKESTKLVEKYMKEVIEASGRPLEIKVVQCNEFSVANVLTGINFKKLGNILCTNADFVPRLQQLLVRERYSSNP
eukprot:jgi/Hompol1/2866/HPOL_006199-RA